MARAVWKGPFVEESLIKKVDRQKNDPNKKPIKTWSRKSTIIPDFVGISFLIYNGKKFSNLWFCGIVILNDLLFLHVFHGWMGMIKMELLDIFTK